MLNRKQKGETNSNQQNFGYEPIKRQEQTLSKPEKQENHHYQKNLVTLKNWKIVMPIATYEKLTKLLHLEDRQGIKI